MPPNNTLTSSDNAAPTAAAPESPAVVTIKRSKVHGTVTAAADDDNKNMSSSSKHDSSAADDWNYWDHLYPVNILWFILLHLGAAYGLTLVFTEAKIATTIFGKSRHNKSIIFKSFRQKRSLKKNSPLKKPFCLLLIIISCVHLRPLPIRDNRRCPPPLVPPKLQSDPPSTNLPGFLQ